jgi:squalene cyclase
MRLYRVGSTEPDQEGFDYAWFSSRRKAEAHASQWQRNERRLAKEEVEEADYDYEHAPTLAVKQRIVNSHMELCLTIVEQVEFKLTKQGVLNLLNVYGVG